MVPGRRVTVAAIGPPATVRKRTPFHIRTVGEEWKGAAAETGAAYNGRVRLHKYIANCGYVSRRRAELLIRAGRVQVNGRTVTEVGTSIYPSRDRVVINSDLVQPPARVTIMLHKLPGFITSTHDTHERLTVMDLLPRMQELGVKPVGRLDQDTAGLLILTNDGDLDHQLTHPRYEIEKEYGVEVEGKPARAALERVERGIMIEGELTAPARVSDVR